MTCLAAQETNQYNYMHKTLSVHLYAVCVGIFAFILTGQVKSDRKSWVELSGNGTPTSICTHFAKVDP